MSSMNVSAVSPADAPPQVARAARAAPPLDADGDQDGTRQLPVAPAPKSAPLAAPGQPGSIVHEVA